MADSNESGFVTRLSNVSNGQGHVAVHSEAESGVSAEQLREDRREVLRGVHCHNSSRLWKPGEERQRLPVEDYWSECPRIQSFAISAREDRELRSFRP
jgi:hypothetical protein